MEAYMVYDGILAVIFLYIAWRGWRQGMLSEILRLAGWVAAFLLIGTYAQPWAEKTYFAVVEKIAVSAVTKAIPAEVISALESGAVAVEALQGVLNSLSGILGGQVIDSATAQSIVTMFRQDAGSLAQIITRTVLQPTLILVVQMLISAAILGLCLFVSRTLARLFSSARRRRDSLLSMTNRLLGLALGIGEGLLTAYVYVFALSLIVLFVNTSWLSQDVLHQTILVSLFL